MRYWEKHSGRLAFAILDERPRSQAGHVAALRLLDMAALRLLVAVGALATAHGALELTEDNWDSALAGKSAFVKFLAPW